MFHILNKIDRKLRERLERVATVAARTGDNGIVDWAVRAANDAVALGRIRDRDIATLKRLEDTYGHDFYRNAYEGNAIHA